MFHPPLSALLLNLLLDELALESRHGLLDLVLGWSWTLQPWMLLDLLERWSIQHVVRQHLEDKISKLLRKFFVIFVFNDVGAVVDLRT